MACNLVWSRHGLPTCTYGKTKPPKHIILPFAIKPLTGNVKLIHTLNRLGHSVSYSQLKEIDTALCLQKLSLSEGDVPLPANIHPGVFTTLAWDNIDRLQETSNGEGTSHESMELRSKPSWSTHSQPKSCPRLTKQKREILALHHQCCPCTTLENKMDHHKPQVYRFTPQLWLSQQV